MPLKKQYNENFGVYIEWIFVEEWGIWLKQVTEAPISNFINQ